MSIINRKKQPLHQRLALSTAISAALLVGYGGRNAYAGTCDPNGAAGTYTCSGVANNATDSSQALNAGANPLIITTIADFGIDTRTSGGRALTLSTVGSSLSFTDNNMSNISGEYTAINARNNGSGATSITTTGSVISTEYYGIDALNGNSATNLTINAATVNARYEGIFVRNLGSGTTSITSTGKVTGAIDGAVRAYIASTASDLIINTVDVTGLGQAPGINVINKGMGSTSISSTGLVKSSSNAGILVSNTRNGTDITLNTVTVSGRDSNGISVSNNGRGATLITNSVSVDATDEGNSGIRASNANTATDLTINAVSVTGWNNGINASNNSTTGTTSITVSGNVSNNTNVVGAGVGINNSTDGNGSISLITLNSGAAVSATSDLAIKDNAGDTTVTLNTGSSVTGIIELGAGDDTINLAGGDFTAVTDFNGGADTDSLIFSGSIGAFDSSLMTDIESVIIDNGSSMGLTFTGNAFDATALTAGLLTVQNGGTLNAGNGFSLTGNLLNTSGIVSLQNAVIDAPATIDGNFTGGGTLNIDTVLGDETSASDVLIITGDTSGNTTINITNLGGLGAATTGNGIIIVQVDGASNDTFSLAGELIVGDYLYNLVQVGNNWYLQSALPAPIVIPTLNQWALALLAGLLAGLGLLGFKRRV